MTGLAVLAALLLSSAAREADDEAVLEWDKVQITGPGVYVVSSCGIVGHGATEREARRATRVVDVDVFDLTVETTHSCFAGGVLAHNY